MCTDDYPRWLGGGRWGRIDDAIILVLRTIQLLYYKAWAPNLVLTLLC